MPRYNDRKIDALSKVNEKFIKACLEIIELGHAKNMFEISQVLKISPTVLSNLHRGTGNRNITLDMVIGICSVYGVNAAYIFPPWQKKIFMGDEKKQMIRSKMLELEQVKRELVILKSHTK